MKYCIGCVHWSAFGHQGGRVYSELTADPDTPARLACRQGHWSHEFDNWGDGSDESEPIYQAMCLAETCADYVERSAPDSSDSPKVTK